MTRIVHGFKVGERPAGVTPGKPTKPVKSSGAAVVVISHNYGRFLAEALESVLNQTKPPAEVLVIDDSSTDRTQQVAAEFRDRGVCYKRIDAGNVHEARKAGFHATHADVLMFLDADDLLPRDYLETGMREFVDDHVGIVYSDMQCFGDQTQRHVMLDSHTDHLSSMWRANYMHATSLVRRDALMIASVFDASIDPRLIQDDWFMWTRILNVGWGARRQASTLQYRKHPGQTSDSRRKSAAGYYDRWALDREKITLFVPLSGRSDAWPALSAFLESQTWPHNQTTLILFDSSENASFSAMVRDWLNNSDYDDVRYVRRSLGVVPGLADVNRHGALDVLLEVRLAMARIYNAMSGMLDRETHYVWTLEDDVIPHDRDVCRKLLQEFDEQTATVTALYFSRFADQPCFRLVNKQLPELCCARELNFPAIRELGTLECQANGFGCLVLRRGLLKSNVFTSASGRADYDRQFYDRLPDHWIRKVVCSATCDHIGPIFKTELDAG